MPTYNHNKKTNNKKSKRLSNFLRLFLFWVIIFAISFALFPPENLFNGQYEDRDLSEVLNLARDHKIAKITVQGDDLYVEPVEGADISPIHSRKDSSSSLQEQGFGELIESGTVAISIKEVDHTSELIFELMLSAIPLVIIGAFVVYIMKQMQTANNQSMGFGKSRARLYGNEKNRVVFADIAGNEAAKQDLAEIVDFLKNPKKYEKLGAKIPRGVLLAGDPGTGKTLMARAVAGEAEVPFFSISGSEFAEMFVGVGASRIRDLFNKAKKNAPSIIFIDEVDAVARKRDGRNGSNREDDQTLNQLLVEMDGFENESGVIVIAATNRIDMLDKALLRPGRFDRHINVTLPERKDREDILAVHFKNKPLDKKVDIKALAAKTAGNSGADLANIANEAAITAARNNHEIITNDDVTEAFERVSIGPKRKSKIMTEHEREVTAYHEAGHAVVGHVLPDSDPVHKVTIVPRGHAGGVTWFLPPEDRSYKSVFELKDILARAMGGRVAERILYGRDGVTTGASSDLKHVAELAREMVTEEGLGEKLRDRVFEDDETNFLGDSIKRYSEKTSELIDQEIEALSTEANKRAELILKENRSLLDKLAKALLDKETLEADEVEKILKGAVCPETAKLHK